jgi:ABC-type phosphate transport system ATPase subunit
MIGRLFSGMRTGALSVLTRKGPGMSNEPAIEASGLAKSYRDVRVLAGVDLLVPDGSVFALLGPNGAGKPDTGLWQSFTFSGRMVTRARMSRHAGTLMPIASSRRIASASKWL